MTECWYEFPDNQDQADAISTLKRSAESLGHRVMVLDASSIGIGVKLASVIGEFADQDTLTKDLRTVLYLGIARGSRRPDDPGLISN